MELRPYLLLDVDGPLNPYRAESPPPGYHRRELHEGEKTWSLLLNPQHAAELTALSAVFDLAWASSWEHGANRLIAPALGLPTNLPVIVWPAGARDPYCDGVSWKTRHVADWVGERPFVWVDDEVGDADRAYLADRPGLGGHLLRAVAADRGMESADFAAIRAWAGSSARRSGGL